MEKVEHKSLGVNSDYPLRAPGLSPGGMRGFPYPSPWEGETWTQQRKPAHCARVFGAWARRGGGSAAPQTTAVLATTDPLLPAAITSESDVQKLGTLALPAPQFS